MKGVNEALTASSDIDIVSREKHRLTYKSMLS